MKSHETKESKEISFAGAGVVVNLPITQQICADLHRYHNNYSRIFIHRSIDID